jgi:hypothetical protein
MAVALQSSGTNKIEFNYFYLLNQNLFDLVLIILKEEMKKIQILTLQQWVAWIPNIKLHAMLATNIFLYNNEIS